MEGYDHSYDQIKVFLWRNTLDVDECWYVLVARGQQVRDNVINDVIDEQLQAAATQYSSVDDWLTDIKMHRYRENFARSGYTHVSQVKHLTLRDLTTKLGVSLVGHQKKILNSVQALRAADDVDVGRTPRSIDPLLT